MTSAARQFCARYGSRLPIVQAPMAAAAGVELAVAAMRGGAVGSLPCALLSPDQIVEQTAAVRAQASGPINLNFFCHRLDPAPDESAWHTALAPLYEAEGVLPPSQPAPLRRPFDADRAAAVEQLRPEIVSFHFGLPALNLLDRVRATGAAVWCSATTLAEMAFLVRAGVDAIIAQGCEAGGHAGWFLDGHQATPRDSLIDAAGDIPIIAAGAIGDAATVAHVLARGAAAVQVGTAYLATPESRISAMHRALLGTPASETVFTTLLTGREARGIRNRLIDTLGPLNPAAPPFPHAASALAPLRARAEADGRGDYSAMWAGAGAAHVSKMSAQALTMALGAGLENIP